MWQRVIKSCSHRATNMDGSGVLLAPPGRELGSSITTRRFVVHAAEVQHTYLRGKVSDVSNGQRVRRNPENWPTSCLTLYCHRATQIHHPLVDLYCPTTTLVGIGKSFCNCSAPTRRDAPYLSYSTYHDLRLTCAFGRLSIGG